MTAFEQWLNDNQGVLPDTAYSALSMFADYLDDIGLYEWDGYNDSEPDSFYATEALAKILGKMARPSVFGKLAEAEHVSICHQVYQRVFVHPDYKNAKANDVVLVYLKGADVIKVTRADISMAIVNGYDITVGHTLINI